MLLEEEIKADGGPKIQKSQSQKTPPEAKIGVHKPCNPSISTHTKNQHAPAMSMSSKRDVKYDRKAKKTQIAKM